MINQLKIITKINFYKLFKWVVLFGITFLYFGRALNDFRETPYIEGDGFEYIIMTEALYNHFTPEIKADDVISLREQLIKHHGLTDYPRKEYMDILIQSLSTKNRPFMQDYNGLYNSKTNTVYSYHFFTYPLYSVIGKVFCMTFNLSPLKAFHLSNALAVIIVCFLLLFFFSKSFIVSVFSALCFCFGVNYWYLGWEHTEIFTTCLVASGLIFYFKERTILGLIILAVATTQNQPLIIFLFSLACITLTKDFLKTKKLNFRLIFKLALIGFIAIIPMLFYYYHYNTTNLISVLDCLDNRYITLNRVTGFYFDINQGMILCLPLILPTYLVVLVLYVFNKNINYVLRIESLVIFIAMIGITTVVSTMSIWNAGQAIVNRYVTWVSAIAFIHLIFLIKDYKPMLKLFLFNNFLVTQIFVCFYFQRINLFDWEFAQHKDIAKWVMANHPDLYNPDPAIFATRTSMEFDVKNKTKPIFYFDENDQLKKLMFNQTNIEAIGKYFFNKEALNKIKTYSKNYNWSYLKEDDFKFMVATNIIYQDYKKERIEVYKAITLKKPDFKKFLPERMKQLNMTENEILEIDATYSFTLEERARRGK